MSISFEDSLKRAVEAENSTLIAPVATVEESEISLMSLPSVASEMSEDIGVIAAYDGAEQWVQSDKYLYYPDYSDESISTIDDEKNIVVNQKQINITQESNSQYIPFEMKRYYDGFDLMKTTIIIHFVNKDGYEDNDSPINVSYTDMDSENKQEDKIRFGWLVDRRVTALEGVVNFEIEAHGNNSKGDEYVWKTRPNGRLNVLQSLHGNGIIKPDETWITGFLSQVSEKVAEAQAAANEASAYAVESRSYAQDALDAANNAQATVDNAKTELSAEVDERISNALDVTLVDYYKSSETDSAISTAMETTLANYYTSEETDEAISSVLDNTLVDYYKSTETDETINTAITNVLLNYYTQEEVDELLENIDISDQLEEIKTDIANIDGLANFNVEYDGSVMTFYNGETVIKEIAINSDPSQEWTAAYTTTVEAKIADAKTEMSDSIDAVQSDLDEYKELTNTDLAGIHEAIDDLPQTLQTDYYNKNEADERFATKEALGSTNTNVTRLESSISTNSTDIGLVSNKLTALEETVNGIDKSPRLTYEATYNTEQVFTLWEIEGEGEDAVRTEKGQFTISGGGGSTTNSELTIGYITKTPLVVTVNDKVEIEYNYSGVDSNNDPVLDGTATWRIDGTVVATHTVSAGENKFDVTEHLKIGEQKVMLSIVDDSGSLVTKTWRVNKIDVRLESEFNDRVAYPVGVVEFKYIPYGNISKTVHFVLDGEEVGSVVTSAYGISQPYDLTIQEHGSHLLDVYMTAELNNNTIESNHIYKDIMVYDETSDTPIISCVQQEFTAKQYDTTTIEYTVYDRTTETPTVTLAVDGVPISTLVLESNTQKWAYKSADIGEHTLTITCGETVKTLNAVIEELDIELSPVTAGLVFDFNPAGKSNNSVDRLWSDGDVAMTVSDNFDWVNGGYQIDENGDQYFSVKAGTSAEINYQLFADDAKINGKEFKLIFKTTNVRRADATFLSCVADNVGVKMNVHEAYVYAGAGSLYLPYSEEDIIEFEFNINKDTNDIPMIMGYEDGVATRPLVYSDTHNFTQIDKQYIKIGSEDCDVQIYRFKVYDNELTDTEILNNFIADARNAEEMISRYNRNKIYDDSNNLTPEKLAEKCPQLRIIMIEAPCFTTGKSDKIKDTTVRCIYKNGDPLLDNWIAKNCMHSGQGTTSNEYGAAGRNIDVIMNDSGDDDIVPSIILGDGETPATKISLTRNSIDVDYLNIKVNIASSENANNALLQKRYNEFNPYLRPIRVSNPKVKDTMEFQNCVVFIREKSEDLSTHTEFNDCEWHFYAIGNIGDSKKTDSTRLNDPTDPLECIVEIMDNTFPNSTFPGDEEGLTNLELDQFDEEMTYGWRYSYNKKDSAITQPCIDKWKEFYKFVVNSTDEEFKSELSNYFVVESALYFYLFTTRYTMIDNRAKNTFWHYGKCEDGVYRWDLCFDYDNDTALGINNSGELVMTYGFEDTDYKVKGDESTGYAYNAALSTFFCRIRDLFADELSGLYVECESNGAWNADLTIKQFDDWQSQFPEELWRVDIERKYLRPYKNGVPRFLNTMMNGRKKYQRRQFERDQEKYMATKFFGNVATSDQIMFRCNTPIDGADVAVKQDYTLHLTPYMDMYLDVLFGATHRKQIRATAGQQYDIECPFTEMDNTAILVYMGSQIQSMGDISACYIQDNDFSNASKLKVLKIGNDTEGYKNSFLTKLNLGNNKLLETLDIQNTPSLTEPLDLSGCGNLIELKAFGSGITGVTFANGGKIETAELPAISSMAMRNLLHLTDLDIADFGNITRLIAEECDVVDVKNIVQSSPKLYSVRITGIEWNIPDTSLLDRIYNMAGIDKNGHNITNSILTGSVHVPVIGQLQRVQYNALWPDLEISADSTIRQFTVTFVNEDGTVLDTQNIDIGNDAVDPTTRSEDPITPIKASSVSHDYTFAGWDSSLTNVTSDRIVTATYTSSLRQYTVRYVAKGYDDPLLETTGYYGDVVSYNGEIPTYTGEEIALIFYLFNRWDKSGLINEDGLDENGVKTITAIYDKFEYTNTSFDGKELADMSPVEIYAMNKLKLADTLLNADGGDPFTLTVGNDFEYDDIESISLVADRKAQDGTEMVFDGTNYYDTGVKLFEEDRDFVLAIDYEFSDANKTNATLAQCFQANGSNGFRLWYSDADSNRGVRFSWSSKSEYIVNANKREMLVVRHKKGENNLTVYKSNLDGAAVQTVEIERDTITTGSAPLVFGAARADDGIFENFAIGEINWCKLWYLDLGDEACRELAMWVHEPITLEACGFRKYYLTDDPYQRCSFSLLASHVLDRARVWSSADSNAGGWAASSLASILNERLYKAFPTQIKALTKRVEVPASIGSKSETVTTYSSYITVPSCIEVDATKTGSPYDSEGTTFSIMTTQESRVRSFRDGDNAAYWLRSSNAQYTSYAHQVNGTGSIANICTLNAPAGVLIVISF